MLMSIDLFLQVYVHQPMFSLHCIFMPTGTHLVPLTTSNIWKLLNIFLRLVHVNFLVIRFVMRNRVSVEEAKVFLIALLEALQLVI